MGDDVSANDDMTPNDDMAALRRRAPQGWGRAMAFPAPDFDAFDPDSFGAFTSAVAFGGLWNRGRLSDRERRLVILTVLALFGRDDVTRLHLQSALAKGDLSAADTEELAVTLATYAGMPVGAAFDALGRRVAAELADGCASDDLGLADG